VPEEEKGAPGPVRAKERGRGEPETPPTYYPGKKVKKKTKTLEKRFYVHMTIPVGERFLRLVFLSRMRKEGREKIRLRLHKGEGEKRQEMGSIKGAAPTGEEESGFFPNYPCGKEKRKKRGGAPVFNPIAHQTQEEGQPEFPQRKSEEVVVVSGPPGRDGRKKEEKKKKIKTILPRPVREGRKKAGKEKRRENSRSPGPGQKKRKRGPPLCPFFADTRKREKKGKREGYVRLFLFI